MRVKAGEELPRGAQVVYSYFDQFLPISLSYVQCSDMVGHKETATYTYKRAQHCRGQSPRDVVSMRHIVGLHYGDKGLLLSISSERSNSI